MRSLRILVTGAVATVVALLLPVFLPRYEAVLEALAAIAFVAAIAFGFLLYPRNEVFYVRTTVQLPDTEGNLSIEHDGLAVKIESVRLWLLFPPTALAVTFLVLTAANGTLWNFSLFDRLSSLYYGAVIVVLLVRVPLAFVAALLWLWISERRVLRNADACSATSVTIDSGWVSYLFVDRHRGYGGGEGFYFGRVRPRVLARLVFYNVQKPEINKIGMGLFFHRPIILTQGLTELDQETVAAHSLSPETASSRS